MPVEITIRHRLVLRKIHLKMLRDYFSVLRFRNALNFANESQIASGTSFSWNFAFTSNLYATSSRRKIPRITCQFTTIAMKRPSADDKQLEVAEQLGPCRHRLEGNHTRQQPKVYRNLRHKQESECTGSRSNRRKPKDCRKGQKLCHSP